MPTDRTPIEAAAEAILRLHRGGDYNSDSPEWFEHYIKTLGDGPCFREARAALAAVGYDEEQAKLAQVVIEAAADLVAFHGWTIPVGVTATSALGAEKRLAFAVNAYLRGEGSEGSEACTFPGCTAPAGHLMEQSTTEIKHASKRLADV